jgi:hypothetical protein
VLEIAAVLALLLCAAPGAVAEERDSPFKRELEVIYVFDGDKTEYVLAIGQVGFKSVAALEKHLESWPAGSELKWAPGCERFGGEPLSSEEELKTSREFLSKRGIKFVLVPSG